jgi:hypothetical protein
VSGLGGLLVIRDGDSNQPVGTTVEITGPRKPAFLDEWADDVQLCAIVNGYALATEFPIVAKALVEEIAQEVTIPISPAIRRTALEEAGVNQINVIEYALKETDPRLGGAIRIGLLVDEAGVPCLKNNEACWELKEGKSGRNLYLTKGEVSTQYQGTRRETVTCMDGILICGQPGRQDDDDDDAWRLGWRGNTLHLGDPFMIDIRGDLKPVITPSRIPPEMVGGGREEPTWKRVSDLLRWSHATAWSSVLGATQRGLTHEDFWRLSLIHRIPIHLMPLDELWKLIHVPTVATDDDPNSEWVALSKLGQVKPVMYGDEKNRKSGFHTEDDRRIVFGNDVALWYPSGYGDADSTLLELLLRFARIALVRNKTSVSIAQPEDGVRYASELGMSDGGFSYTSAIEYVGEANELLSVQSEFRSVNRNHPVVKYVQQYQDQPYRDRTDFQHYCASVIWMLSDDTNLTALAAANIEKGRQYRRLGTIFSSIDWSRQDSSLAPPYRVWTTDGGVVEITKEDLIRWAGFTKAD